MGNKTDYRDAFHTELRSFMKNLCKTFDDDHELMMMTSSLLIAISDDPEDKVITNYRDTVLPHKALVDARDATFFYKINNTEYKLMSQLHLYWERLNAADQKVVWDYIQVLLALSIKVLPLV